MTTTCPNLALLRHLAAFVHTRPDNWYHLLTPQSSSS
jgi:hypothetical protein